MQFKIIYIVNLWLDRQVIGLIFPIHCSEHFAMQNVASELAIGFIFPIQWSELSTSLKAILRMSDLSFGSLKMV